TPQDAPCFLPVRSRSFTARYEQEIAHSTSVNRSHKETRAPLLDRRSRTDHPPIESGQESDPYDQPDVELRTQVWRDRLRRGLLMAMTVASPRWPSLPALAGIVAIDSGHGR